MPSKFLPISPDEFYDEGLATRRRRGGCHRRRRGVERARKRKKKLVGFDVAVPFFVLKKKTNFFLWSLSPVRSTKGESR